MAMNDERSSRAQTQLSLGAALAILLLIAFAVLAVQNTRPVTVRWLGIDTEQPLWAVLVLTGAAGVVVAKLITFAWHHRD